MYILIVMQIDDDIPNLLFLSFASSIETVSFLKILAKLIEDVSPQSKDKSFQILVFFLAQHMFLLKFLLVARSVSPK